MQILNKFVAIATLTFLLALVVEQSFSHPTNDEGELRIVKRGIFDCPHNCWGSANNARNRCGDSHCFIRTFHGACFCCDRSKNGKREIYGDQCA